VSATEFEQLARNAYEAHRAVCPDPRPAWEDANDQEQHAWFAAVSAITSKAEATLTEMVPAHPLVVQAENQTHVFQKDFTVGRQGTLRIGDDHASSHHAAFQFAHGLWYVEDLDSTNGTWLNGRRIFASQRLKKGDKVRIGRTTVVVVST
jgi:pSer/pThr/pTyr-binding forkhead associated (FHA) protein